MTFLWVLMSLFHLDISKEVAVPHVHEDTFYVAGYSVRTSNADEMSGHGKIGMLWQRFSEGNLEQSIPHRADEDLIVVYSDYASDENGEFTYLLGARVTSTQDLPPNLTNRQIAPGDYAIFTTRPGPLVEVLQETWKAIWNCPPDTLGGQRAFVTDYEIHDRRSRDPLHAQVEIHIGLTARRNAPEENTIPR